MRRIYIMFAVLFLSLIIFSCARLSKWEGAHTPPDDNCAHCHYAIYKDWNISYRPFNEAAKSEDYTPVHSRPMSAADVRKRRSHDEGRGDCSECHVVREKRELLSISGIGASFEETIYQICGRCHEKTFGEWKLSPYLKKEVSCLICHTDTRDMPVKEEKGYYHTTEGIEGFSKGTMTPSLMLERLQKAVTVVETVEIEKGKITVYLIVRNEGVGHDVPTDAINAALDIRVKLLDAKGGVIEVAGEVIGRGKTPGIPAEREAYYDIKMKTPSPGKYSIQIALDHRDEAGGESHVLKLFSKSIDINIE